MTWNRIADVLDVWMKSAVIIVGFIFFTSALIWLTIEIWKEILR